MSPRPGLLWLALALAASAHAQEQAPPAPSISPTTTVASPPAPADAVLAPPASTATVPAPWTGGEIYARFRTGLAEPGCGGGAASTRWRTHFAHAPGQLAQREGDVLPLFGYVVEAVRQAGLPSEYALIPFVESGYRPSARSPQGPAGLWQMIAITARNHQVAIRPGYDGRLSPVDSTAAAVRYLKKLHGMFAGNWRLAVMAYNAGEYRVLGAIKRSGSTIAGAKAESLPGLSPITQAYVRKLHALSCLMDQAHTGGQWAAFADQPVPRLEAVSLPASVRDIAAWARAAGQDPARLQRLNPAFVHGRVARADGAPARVLAVAAAPPPATGAVDSAAPAATIATVGGAQPLELADASAPLPDGTSVQAGAAEAVAAAPAPFTPRRHTIVRGDNPTTIAARYGIRVADLLSRNDLDARSVLRPGSVLLIDPAVVAGTPAAGTR